MTFTLLKTPVKVQWFLFLMLTALFFNSGRLPVHFLITWMVLSTIALYESRLGFEHIQVLFAIYSVFSSIVAGTSPLSLVFLLFFTLHSLVSGVLEGSLLSAKIKQILLRLRGRNLPQFCQKRFRGKIKREQEKNKGNRQDTGRESLFFLQTKKNRKRKRDEHECI